MSDSNGSHGDAPANAASAARRPLTIVIGCDTFPPDVNGAARFAERLAAGLVERGHRVHIIAPALSRRGHGVFEEEHSGQVMTVHRLKSWRWYPHDWLRFVIPWHIEPECARILDEVKPDVVHFQSHIIVGRGLSKEAAARGIRIVGTNHMMPENMLEFTLIPRFLQPFAVRQAWKAAWRSFSRAQAVTTPTRKAADYLERCTGLQGVHAISCGIHVDDYVPNFLPRSENRILFVGRITGEKRIDVLVRAFAKLPEDLDARLEIVGSGDQVHQLEKLVEQTGVSGRVTFTGYVDDDALRAAYTRASVFAIPSTAELQSIVTMEAMASGLPVVAADAMALPHLVHDGENGYLFEPDDDAALAARLTQVLGAPPARYEALKRASLKLIKAHDIARTISTFESLYRGESVTDPVDTAPVSTQE